MLLAICCIDENEWRNGDGKERKRKEEEKNRGKRWNKRGSCKKCLFIMHNIACSSRLAFVGRSLRSYIQRKKTGSLNSKKKKERVLFTLCKSYDS